MKGLFFLDLSRHFLTLGSQAEHDHPCLWVITFFLAMVSACREGKITIEMIIVEVLAVSASLVQNPADHKR